MFVFGRVKERTISSESLPQTELEERPGKLKRHGTLQSLEVFQAWAKDSFLRDSTVDILVTEHEIDCIPAVLALKREDISQLGLPVGQQRLLEGAVEKLKQEYELVRPPTPRTKISLDMPAYKTMLEFTEKSGMEGVETGESEDLRSLSSQEGQTSREVSRGFYSPPYSSEGKLEKEGLLKLEEERISKQAVSPHEGKGSRPPAGSQSRHHLVGEEVGEEVDVTGFSCQRWLICLFFMPFFVVICLVGVVLWIIMVPFILCCPHGGCYANVVTDIFEHTVMAPVRACRWAATKQHEALTHGTTKKRRYGGTEDPEKAKSGSKK